MITAVVFSRNRACQLDLLLTSLERNAPGVFDVNVLCRADTDDHQDAYRMCRGRFPHATFWYEGTSVPHLAADLLSATDLGCFFTDDSVLYVRMPPPFLLGGVLCFSPRLGRNTTWCYPHGFDQMLPHFSGGWPLLEWNWKTAHGDFGYPASVDGHVFRSSDLVDALSDCPSTANPNQIEEHLVKHFANDHRQMMASYPQSCLVGIPANVVTDTHRNRHAHGPTADDLCAAYLAGKRLDLDAMDFSDVRGAHQDIELVLA